MTEEEEICGAEMRTKEHQEHKKIGAVDDEHGEKAGITKKVRWRNRGRVM
jgi:hypothetical protein